MLLNRATFRLHLPWIVICVAGTFACGLAAVDFASGGIQNPRGSSLTGLVCGTVAALLMVFECLLWPRKRLFRRWRLGRTRTWMCAHIWLGILTVPLVLAHGGVVWRGWLAIALLVVFFIVIASGLLGWLAQTRLPRMILDTVPEETIFSQIETVAAHTVSEADAAVSAACGAAIGLAEAAMNDHHGAAASHVVVGAERSIALAKRGPVGDEPAVLLVANSGVLLDVYQQKIRPFLQEGRRSTSPVRRRHRSDETFSQLKVRMGDDAHPVIDRLAKWCDERRQLDRQARLHFWLHSWLMVHLPLSMALLVLLAWHIVVALKYSGILALY